MNKTFVAVYFVPSGKKERFAFPDLNEIFQGVRIGKLTHKRFFSKFDEEKYLEVYPNERKLFGVVKQELISDEEKEFTREVNIRYDGSKHDNTETHLNLDLITRYTQANEKQKHFLKETHQLFLKNKGIQALHILLSTPGSSVQRTVVFLPTLKDRTYHEKQNIFLQKLKSKRLNAQDEANFKKEVKSYAKYISS
ncbi:hypothetical protein HYY70_03445 [Candidatus Woesearchaeota archaeon]|nr:hypothetical protein [Candidatus Woesearchaeota archaeon]